jgi:hypothetical protein
MESTKVVEKVLSTADGSIARGEGRADLAAIDRSPLFREGTRLLIHNLDEDGIKTATESTIVVKDAETGALSVVYDGYAEMYGFDPAEDEYDIIQEEADALDDPRKKLVAFEVRKLWAVCQACNLYYRQPESPEGAEDDEDEQLYPDRVLLEDCLSILCEAQKNLPVLPSGAQLLAEKIASINRMIAPALSWRDSCEMLVGGIVPDDADGIRERLVNIKARLAEGREVYNTGFCVEVDTERLESEERGLKWAIEAKQALALVDDENTSVEQEKLEKLASNKYAPLICSKLYTRVASLHMKVQAWEARAKPVLAALRNNRSTVPVQLKDAESVIAFAQEECVPGVVKKTLTKSLRDKVRIKHLEQITEAIKKSRARDLLYQDILSVPLGSPEFLPKLKASQKMLASYKTLRIVTTVSTMFEEAREEMVLLKNCREILEQLSCPNATKVTKETLLGLLDTGDTLLVAQSLNEATEQALALIKTEVNKINAFETDILTVLNSDMVRVESLENFVIRLKASQISLPRIASRLQQHLTFLAWKEVSGEILEATRVGNTISAKSLARLTDTMEKVEAMEEFESTEAFFASFNCAAMYGRVKTTLAEIESVDREGKELFQLSGLSKVPKLEVLVYLEKAKARKVECDQVIKVREALEQLQAWEAAVEIYLNGPSLLESQEKWTELNAAQHALLFSSPLYPVLQIRKSALEWIWTTNQLTEFVQRGEYAEDTDKGKLKQQNERYHEIVGNMKASGNYASDADLNRNLLDVHLRCNQAIWLSGAHTCLKHGVRPSLNSLITLKTEYKNMSFTSHSDLMTRIESLISQATAYENELATFLKCQPTIDHLQEFVANCKEKYSVITITEEAICSLLAADAWKASVRKGMFNTQSQVQNKLSMFPNVVSDLLQNVCMEERQAIKEMQRSLQALERDLERVKLVLSTPSSAAKKSIAELESYVNSSAIRHWSGTIGFDLVDQLRAIVENIKQLSNDSNTLFERIVHLTTSDDAIPQTQLEDLQANLNKVTDASALLPIPVRDDNLNSLSRSARLLCTLTEREFVRKAFEQNREISSDRLQKAVKSMLRDSTVVPLIVDTAYKEFKQFKKRARRVLSSRKSQANHCKAVLEHHPKGVVVSEEYYFLELFEQFLLTDQSTDMREQSAEVRKVGPWQFRWIKYENYPYWPGVVIWKPKEWLEQRKKSGELGFSDIIEKELIDSEKSTDKQAVYLFSIAKFVEENRNLLYINTRKDRDWGWRSVAFSEKDPNRWISTRRSTNFANSIIEAKEWVKKHRALKKVATSSDVVQGTAADDSNYSSDCSSDIVVTKPKKSERKPSAKPLSTQTAGGKKKGAPSQRRHGVNPEMLKRMREAICDRFEYALDTEDSSVTRVYTSQQVAHKIEEALYNLHVGMTDEYNAGVRTLMANLKSNQELRKQLLDGSLTAHKIVRFSSAELADKKTQEQRKIERQKKLKESIVTSSTQMEAHPRMKINVIMGTKETEKEEDIVAFEHPQDPDSSSGEEEPRKVSDEQKPIKLGKKTSRFTPKKRSTSVSDEQISNKRAKLEGERSTVLTGWTGAIKMKNSGSFNAKLFQRVPATVSVPFPVSTGASLDFKGRATIDQLLEAIKTYSSASNPPVFGSLSVDDPNAIAFQSLLELCAKKPVAFLRVEAGYLYLIMTNLVSSKELRSISKFFDSNEWKHECLAVLIQKVSVKKTRRDRRSRSASLQSNCSDANSLGVSNTPSVRAAPADAARASRMHDLQPQSAARLTSASLHELQRALTMASQNSALAGRPPSHSLAYGQTMRGPPPRWHPHAAPLPPPGWRPPQRQHPAVHHSVVYGRGPGAVRPEMSLVDRDAMPIPQHNPYGQQYVHPSRGPPRHISTYGRGPSYQVAPRHTIGRGRGVSNKPAWMIHQGQQ